VRAGHEDCVAFSVSSTAFEHGAQIPQRHTCEGEDRSPPLSWSDPPDRTRSLALICDDPDAPSGVFVHWLAWGIDPGQVGLGEGESAPVEGTGGFGDVGYRGPCPPPGHGAHRYFFRLYALDEELQLGAGAGREELDAALEGQVLESAELMGTFER
jgi:Raf kinase inhibitor-like YbhB/YbcL family protein